LLFAATVRSFAHMPIARVLYCDVVKQNIDNLPNGAVCGWCSHC